MGHDFGRFVWRELMSRDFEAAKGFYGELLNWTYSEVPMPDGAYTMIHHGEAPIAGLTKPPMDEVPPHWAGYVSVEDVDATAAKFVKAGGASLMDAFDVPGVGRMAAVKDDQGGALLLFHAAEGDGEPTTGHGAWHWAELWAKDGAKAAKFYADVLGYQTETMAMPTGDYHVLKSGDAPRAGVMTAPGGAPTHWAHYVEVEDVNASVAKAKKLGGKLMGELMNVEGVGEFGFVADREGSVLGLITPAAK